MVELCDLATHYIHNELQWFDVSDQSEKSDAPVNLGFQNPESIFVNMNYIEGSGDTHLTKLQYANIRNKREEENIQ